jgi:hypothetical protein
MLMFFSVLFMNDLKRGIWYLTPLSTMFQLHVYRDGYERKNLTNAVIGNLGKLVVFGI